MRTEQHRSLAALVGALTFGASPGLAQDYTVTDLGVTGIINHTWAINAHGQIAGYSLIDDGHGNQHYEGYFYDGEAIDFVGTRGAPGSDLLGINNLGEAVGKLWGDDGQAILRRANGRVQQLGTLGGARSYARAVNDLGQVVGSSHLANDYDSRPFVWQNGVMTALPILGGTQGVASWINNAGQIVGTTTTDTDDLQQFGVLWEGGDPVRLPPHNGHAHIPWFIHDNGDIVGLVHFDGPNGLTSRGALWHDGRVEILGTLADDTPVEEFASSWASGINAHGVIVGMSVNELSQSVPFVMIGGEMLQIDRLIPGAWLGVWVGDGAINDAGQIAMEAVAPDGTSHALLLTPVPTCRADFNRDGAVDTLDVLAFLDAFSAGDDSADINGDGTVNTLDVLCFLNAWSAGC